MARFLLRRFVYLVVLVVLATAFAYVLAATQLNPRSNFEGRNPPPPAAVVDAHLDQLNLNDKTPVWKRIGHWSNGVIHGNLGQTIDGVPIGTELNRRVWVSVRLLLIGSLIGTILAVATGAFAAVRQYRISDHVLAVFTFLVLSAPTVVLSVMVKQSGTAINNAVGQKLVYNTGEYTPGINHWDASGILDRIQHLILPSIVLVLITTALYGRYQRNSMLDVLGSDFLRTAQAKGLRRPRALIKHGLRTALIPMATFFAYEFALLFVGAVFVEPIFGWHGMGEWFVQSVQRNDVNSVAAVTLFVAVLVLAAGFLSDLAYAALDPRVRVS
jgi:peptide/nickel transport system permease protein